ncbi:MAG: hypothetical protein IPM38_15085 [Ignavibacteria bacterium]|nr:hypothetical protein [Ignavibacteria bacterium]
MSAFKNINSFEIASDKIYKEKEKPTVKTEAELAEEEKIRSDKFEDIAIFIPVIFLLLGIIIMSILYKLYM